MPDTIKRKPEDQTQLFEQVCKVERDVIERRRHFIKDKYGRERTGSPVTGLALSGGGIRSASFGLGVLQALQAKHENHPVYGIEGIDYLSTVSGGGYIGSSLTAALQKTEGKFPFVNVDKPEDYADTSSVRHIRDYSNYLIPHGALDIVTALGIIGRGIVANWLIVAPVLLFFVWITLFIHPTVESLHQPKFLKWDLADALAKLGLPVSDPLWGLSGYWFTVILLAINVLFLMFWAFAKSISVSQLWQKEFSSQSKPGNSAELRGGLVTISKLLFFVTVTAVWVETQPFILNAMTGSSPPELTSAAPGASLGEILRKWFEFLTPMLAPIGAIVAFLGKYLGDIVAIASRQSNRLARVKKILAMTALWFAAIVIPSFLWLIYLKLTYFGLSCSDATFPFAPDWLLSLANAAPFQGMLQKWGFTTIAGFYLEAFVIFGLVALFINPNVTSLYRLYRDRLSKAFLFDPDPDRRDKRDDLESFEPKLHQICTNLCPYPIVNAALNIEGSQFANKRGRNADFFIFTPKFTGSDATRYIDTGLIEKDESALDLGTAMAISAAAVSSNMGSATIKLLSFTLAFLNVRLGYWLRNPRAVREDRSLLSRMLDVRSFLLLKEMFGWISEKSPTVYLTDGGHIENLGVYSLMKRCCDVIIAVDAEADPGMSFDSLLKLERYARIDLGATVNLPWQKISKQALSLNNVIAEMRDSSGIPPLLGPDCAACEIEYGSKQGILLYIKASLSGDEADYILDYKYRNQDFPHETTSDQFFNEEQLEAYRALGFHVMQGLLTGEIPCAVEAETEEAAKKKREEILKRIHAALLGTNTKAAADADGAAELERDAQIG